jgi:hypothetical protein
MSASSERLATALLLDKAVMPAKATAGKNEDTHNSARDLCNSRGASKSMDICNSIVGGNSRDTRSRDISVNASMKRDASNSRDAINSRDATNNRDASNCRDAANDRKKATA